MSARNRRRIGYWIGVAALGLAVSTQAVNWTGRLISWVGAGFVGALLEEVGPLGRWLGTGGAPSAPPAEPDGTTPAPRERRAQASAPRGSWLVLAGAVSLVVAVFLPEDATPTSARIVDDALIQDGGGWIFLALVAVALVSLYAAHRSGRSTWIPAVAGAVATALAIHDATSSSALRLCSVTDSSLCLQASPGIGVYLAVTGGALMMIGGWRVAGRGPERGAGPRAWPAR